MPVGDKTQIELIYPLQPEGLVSLREYVDTRLAHYNDQYRERSVLEDKALEARFVALEKAVQLAALALEVRMLATNEWHKTVDRILDTTVVQGTYEVDVGRLRTDVADLKVQIGHMVRREDYTTACSSTQTALAEIRQYRAESLITRAEYELHGKAVAADIESLKLSRATLAGKAEQSSVNIALLLGVISTLLGIGAFVIGVIGLVLRFFGG